jgi:predicted MPP superfamily phosphohydrolase
VRLRTIEVELDRLPPELDGLRVVHLSDFHLGLPSRGAVAVERAVDWTAERKPHLVCLSGDLLSRGSGEGRLRALLPRLPQPAFAILGNHDFAISRDPFSEPTGITDLAPVRLLSDEAETIELRGRSVHVAGSDPRSRWSRRRKRPAELAVGDADADLSILLCHYPQAIDSLPEGAFDLVLAGHMHDGQISIPLPGTKLRLAHPTARYTSGLYRRPGGVLHVSPGLGTTFVPFRFFARPEATELVLRAGSRV